MFLCVFVLFLCTNTTQTHKHTNGALFLYWSVGKMPSPQDEPPSRCVCVCLCTKKHKQKNGALFLCGSVGKMPSPQDEPPSRCVCVFVSCLCTNTQTHKHTNTQTDPYFCAGRSEKCQVPRTSPRVDVFVCVCVVFVHKHDTNTQTHKR